MKDQPILRVFTKQLLPYILLFALYTQFHGDFGPGGGFQAGVIFAAGFVLFALVFGLGPTRRFAPDAILERLMALGVLIYIGTGIVAVLRGANFLDYGVLLHDPVHGQHLGIFSIELGVGITVSAVMLAIFFAFAGRGKPE